MIDDRTWSWTRLVGVPLAAVALLGLAACGTSTESGTSDGASAAAADTATETAAAADPADTGMAAYRSCLEENGVSMPEPPAGGPGTPPQGGTPPSGAPAAGGPGGAPDQAPPGVDDDTWAAAQEACSALAPTPPGGTAPTG